MDDQTQMSLNEIINYLYADEQTHWHEAGQPKTGHIFCDLFQVVKWLNGIASVPR